MKKIKNNAIKKYCTGCGLCKSLNKARLEINSKGFYSPVEGDEAFLNKVCPSCLNKESSTTNNIWGKNNGVYFGWSKDSKIRLKASSGGILTTLAVYLLKSKKVDYIIQIGADENNPTKTSVYISDNPKHVIQRAGSRYCISHPLEKINEVDKTKKYAFIGRPCDITVLKNYLKIDLELKQSIIYLLSFFCMGIPSNDVQDELLKKLDCIECKKLVYRGNGWPGKTTAIDFNGEEKSMEYLTSWGKILGRDLMPMCRFCIDGIGEDADISCGDAWYLAENGGPDFSEHDGRNIIFSRTNKGKSLLLELKEKKLIELDNCDNYNNYLKEVQKSQFERRKNMYARIMALKTMRKTYPNYPIKLLKQYSKDCSKFDWVKTYVGTIKRIIKNKI